MFSSASFIGSVGLLESELVAASFEFVIGDSLLVFSTAIKFCVDSHTVKGEVDSLSSVSITSELVCISSQDLI